jgi:hypothetical protein
MLKTTLEFLTEELNSWLQLRDPLNFQDAKPAAITTLMKPDGKFAVNSNSGQANDKFSIAVTLVNIEEESTFKNQPHYRQVQDKVQVVQPPMNVNIYVLFSAVADMYPTALTLLNHLLAFFQANPVFDESSHPHLNAKVNPAEPWNRLQRIVVDFYNVSFEQQNNLWAALGAKYMPSALYKIRSITYTDQTPKQEGPPITEINLNTR